jgi:hypothetical protein
MAVKPEEAKASVVEKAIAHVRERLSGSHTTEVECFVRAYYAEAAPEDLGELDLYGAGLSQWQLLQRHLPGEVKAHAYRPSLRSTAGSPPTPWSRSLPTTCPSSSTRWPWPLPAEGARSISSSIPASGSGATVRGD